MLRQLSFQCVGPFEDLKLDLAPRLNLFTGDNGLGKSLVLEVAWWALTGSWAGETMMPGRRWLQRESRLGFAADGDPTWMLSPENRGAQPPGMHQLKAMYNQRFSRWHPENYGEDDLRVMVAGLIVKADGSVAAWDPLKSHPEADHGFPGGESTFGIVRTSNKGQTLLSARELWDGKREGDTVLCAGLIQDWTGWQRSHHPAFERLKAVIAALSSPPEPMSPGEPMRVRMEDRRDIPTIVLPYDTVPVTLASAGMKRILGLAYAIVWAWTEHLETAKLLGEEPSKELVLIFDEVEAHLHPQWQRSILPALIAVLEDLAPKVQVFASSHSPLVLASLEPHFDPERDALWKMDLVGGQVQVERDLWYRRGTADRWLTSDVFDLESARSLDAEEALKLAKQAVKKPDLSVEELRAIHRRLQVSLGEADPFWPLWLDRAQRAGIEP